MCSSLLLWTGTMFAIFFYGVTTAYPLKPVKKSTRSNLPECLKGFKDTSSLRDSQGTETQNHK